MFCLVNAAWSDADFSPDSDQNTFSLEEALLWIMDSYFSKKSMDLFHLLSSPDVNWWTGVLWSGVMFYQTLILTAPIHCRASIAETLMQRHISTNSSHHSQHIVILWWTIALSRIDAITDKHRKTDICSFVSALVTSGKKLNEKCTPVNTVKLS